jgi:hypothetical protein
MAQSLRQVLCFQVGHDRHDSSFDSGKSLTSGTLPVVEEVCLGSAQRRAQTTRDLFLRLSAS